MVRAGAAGRRRLPASSGRPCGAGMGRPFGAVGMCCELHREQMLSEWRASWLLLLVLWAGRLRRALWSRRAP